MRFMYSSLRSMQHSANASFGPVARESQTCTNTRTCRDGSDSWYKYLCGWVKGPFSVQPLQSGSGATANRQLKFACPIGPVTRSCTSDSCGGASVGCTCAGGEEAEPFSARASVKAWQLGAAHRHEDVRVPCV